MGLKISRFQKIFSMSRSKSRAWCFTINNYDDQTEDAIKQLYQDTDSCLYLCYGHEVGEEKKTPHLQGYVYFENPRTMRGVSRMDAFSRAHLAAAKGSARQNREYCSKQDTANFVELGEMPRQGDRTDISAFLDAVKEGADDYELMCDFPREFVKYGRAIDRARSATLKRKARSFRQVTVTTLIGPTGTGKTRLAFHMDPDLYVVPNPSGASQLWFDGYTGQKTILLDDFYGWIKYGFLLRLLDGHRMQAAIKGSFTAAAWTQVIITSNQHPSQWYQKGLTPALKRRLDTDGIYTVELSESGRTMVTSEDGDEKYVDWEDDTDVKEIAAALAQEEEEEPEEKKRRPRRKKKKLLRRSSTQSTLILTPPLQLDLTQENDEVQDGDVWEPHPGWE
jgi:hypothetical protein